MPVCGEEDCFPAETSGVTPRTYLYTFTRAPGGFPCLRELADSSYYTFISLKEVFYILPCNPIPLAPHPAKKEKYIQSKQFLKPKFSSLHIVNVHNLCSFYTHL